MSLYPSLEDMKVDKMAQAQRNHETAAQQSVQWPAQGAQSAPNGQSAQQAIAYPPQGSSPGASLYPSLTDYMGLQITPEMMAVVPQHTQVAVPTPARPSPSQMMVAPVTGANMGLMRAEIKQGLREVLICKDGNGKMGLRVRHVNQGLFVALVDKNSPAALGGLRFGDQILQINGQTVAGWDNDKAHKFLKNANPQKITMAVRDRPFERTITMQKDSQGFIGFLFKKGKITNLVKDSSAARNGVLTEHHLVEVNGQNVVGIKDDDIGDIISAGGKTVTITVMPSFVYEHIVKCMGNSLIKKNMDHSIPDL